MKNLATFVLALLFSNALFAQKSAAPPLREANFSVTPVGNAHKFEPILPPASQVAGAPEAYWTYVWEFGDGGMSTKKSPTHTYIKEGEFMATLDATAHYDDGKKATRKKTKVVKTNREALSAIETEDAFDPKEKQAIAMTVGAQPREGEELSFIISYRNKSPLPIDGHLHLFFNEKKFPTRHFNFLESRPCFGEVEVPLYSQSTPDAQAVPWADWSAVGMLAAAQVQAAALEGDFPVPTIVLEARSRYREERAWKFENLEAGEKRNFFLSLETAPTIVKDVNTLIHVQGIFVPADPTVPAEPYTLEMKIVVAHDPNAIAVSDNRINYRTLGNKKIDYKVEFQNNGKGPASTVMLKIEIPDGLSMKKLKPLDWQPKCPICPRAVLPKTSCLDTMSTTDGFQFIFHKIYLPGAAQEGVENRDSTKGFVKYRIEADKDMPKYSFRSRAKIIFDREAPIYTNYTRTRFKVGISPGIKVGWNFVPDSLKNGFYFIGASLSPFKSWRMYPQVELLAGLKGSQTLPEEQKSALVETPNPGLVFRDSTFFDTLVQARRGFVSFEIPVLLRKNFNNRLGLGFGISARVSIEDGETRTETSMTCYNWEQVDKPPIVGIFKTIEQSETSVNVEPFSNTRYAFTAFGDLTFGSVRSGPNLGIRAGAVLGKGREFQPFVQFSVEVKM
ncbi:MAG: PKD domain-containing protein [Saprospiraceae bacterium]